MEMFKGDPERRLFAAYRRPDIAVAAMGERLPGNPGNRSH
jgi:hypothetical protein